MAWPIIRLVVAALFAWSASLLTPLDRRRAARPVRALRHPRHRRPAWPARRSCAAWTGSSAGSWSATTRPPSAFAPLRRCVTTPRSSAPSRPARTPTTRAAASPRSRWSTATSADRVVIATRHADDKGLLDLVRSFKSIGVPVSLLPRPLDLLEAPAARPNNVGGVPLIDVEALAARTSVPYARPGPPSRSKDQSQRRGPRHERGGEHRPRAEPAPRRPLRGDPRRRQLPRQHDRGGQAGLSRHPRADPERPRQGRCLPHRLRRRQGQPGRDARRRRLRRPGRDPPFRRGPRSGSGLRQGLPLPSRRRQRRHHADPQARQRGASAERRISCTERTSPTSVTATTPSGPAACRSSPSTCPASRSRR